MTPTESPNARATSAVRSVQPLQTTTISSSFGPGGAATPRGRRPMTASSLCAAITTESAMAVLIASHGRASGRARFLRLVRDGLPEAPARVRDAPMQRPRTRDIVPDGVARDEGHYPHWGEGSRGAAGDKNSMLIRRRPSAATLVAIVATLVIGSQTVLPPGGRRGAPEPSARSRSRRPMARASRSPGRPRVTGTSPATASTSTAPRWERRPRIR